MNATARQLITALGLEPLPHEGGYFRVTRRTATLSGILFLITPEDFSALHRIAQDEVWHFHAGDAVEHVQLDPRDGAARTTRLGPEILRGEAPEVLVPAGHWQGARLAEVHHGFALLGCTVSPPWEEAGFALADRAALAAVWPRHGDLIARLTR